MRYEQLSRRQLLALTWWARPEFQGRDAILCDGAIRSGKTVCLTEGFLLWSMSRFDRQSFAICGRTIEALRRNIIMNLEEWTPPNLRLTERRSANTLTVSDERGRRNTYFLFGGRDESAYALIQGSTLAGVLLDEAALMPRSFVEQAAARCSVPGSKLWLSCNPMGPEHWLYREWLTRARARNALRLHFTMDDNPALDPAVRARYQRMYAGVFYRRYVLGEWCMAEGLVYEFDRARHVTDRTPESGRWYISCDYGTMNPFSAGLWCVEGGRAVRVREYYYSGRDRGRQKTDQEYYAALEELAGDRPVECVVVDPSAASFLTLIRRRGRFSARKANNDVLAGIQLTARLLGEGRLLIHRSCADAIREFGLYRWDPAPGRDRVIKEHDHAMDDIRYFCSTILKDRLDRTPYQPLWM